MVYGQAGSGDGQEQRLANLVRERAQVGGVYAFPDHTEHTHAEQAQILHHLPKIDSPESMFRRLSEAVRFGFLRLDLARVDLDGSWRLGDRIDLAVRELVDGLHTSPHLQRQLGVKSLSGVISRGSIKANSRAFPQELDHNLTSAGICLVTRQRTLGRVASWNAGDEFEIAKTSTFIMRGAPTLVTVAAQTVIRGGIPPAFAQKHGYSIEQLFHMDTYLRTMFGERIEAAIAARQQWLRPEQMGYWVGYATSIGEDISDEA